MDAANFPGLHKCSFEYFNLALSWGSWWNWKKSWWNSFQIL